MPKAQLSSGSVKAAPLSTRDLNSVPVAAQASASNNKAGNDGHTYLLTSAGVVNKTGLDKVDPAIWDDCNDVRRKIRADLAAGNKVTHFLREIGNINSNCYRRFMAATGPNGGQQNGCFSAAYYFFEKKRIAENKPKTAKRKRNEEDFPAGGHDTGREKTHVRVYVGRN